MTQQNQNFDPTMMQNMMQNMQQNQYFDPAAFQNMMMNMMQNNPVMFQQMMMMNQMNQMNNNMPGNNNINAQAQPVQNMQPAQKMPQNPMGGGGMLSIAFEIKNKSQNIVVQALPGDLLEDAIKKFESKAGLVGQSNQIKYIFNSKSLPLGMNLTLAQAGVQDGSKITVIGIGDLEGA